MKIPNPLFWIGLALFSTFTVYLLTMCPTVYLGDSGELTAAAYALGIAHGSGYPLYTLVGKLFCLIPLGNIAFRMNLMSACLGVATVWLVYSLIMRMTGSRLGAFVGSLFLAFTPVFWFQMVSAEVYTLHAFFVALLIRLLWWWDERREFLILVLFVFVVGLSFGNHLQTVMLAPGVLWIVVSGDRRVLWNLRRFMILGLFFVIPLLIYVYLPIRTEAGAAIHWGDPNTWERFWAHVSGRSHRGSYVMNEAVWESWVRTKEALWFVWSQFGVVLFLSVWGWVKSSMRWRVFWVLVMVFDFVYTVFLNTISLKITPFNLSTCIGLAVLTGVGVKHVVAWMRGLQRVGMNTRRVVQVGFGVIPVLALVLNFQECNQSKNYTAYEQALNIFRTASAGDVIFMNGDNFVFPVVYGRIVERMEETVRIYDRLNVVFKIADIGRCGKDEKTSWVEKRNRAEQEIIKATAGHKIFYAVFGAYSIWAGARYRLLPYGVLYRVVREGEKVDWTEVERVWRCYATESFDAEMARDFMNREVYGYFYFKYGKYLMLSSRPAAGLSKMRLASHVAHDDTLIHSDIAVFLIDQGFFEEARQALEKASVYNEDLSGIHNNWGYYYHKQGDYEKAIGSFKRAIELVPNHYGYQNNLAFAYYEAGDLSASLRAFQKSLALNAYQPKIRKFVEEHLSKNDPGS
jgi:tetratricopeptide (TPR) repeat protein